MMTNNIRTPPIAMPTIAADDSARLSARNTTSSDPVHPCFPVMHEWITASRKIIRIYPKRSHMCEIFECNYLCQREKREKK